MRGQSLTPALEQGALRSTLSVSPERLIKLPGFDPESGSDVVALVVQVWALFLRRAKNYVLLFTTAYLQSAQLRV